MKTIFFSSDNNIIEEWELRHNINNSLLCTDINFLLKELKNTKDNIFIADYDTVSNDVNTLISSNQLPDKFIVLEKVPELVTGKMLIMHGVKAYGNARMLTNHYAQMIQTVQDGNIWTYPELTNILINKKPKSSLNNESVKLIDHRLSDKEKEVIYLILKGLTNNAIASSLNITVRTVKAHVSSIFSKLHVNDRVALILLLK